MASFTRIYKLYSSSVASSSAVASLTIPRNGNIVAITMSAEGATGAGATNTMAIELSMASTSTLTTNDTPGNSLLTFTVGSNVASSACADSVSLPGIAIPVVAGDKLYLHQSGGTFANLETYVHVAIVH